MTRADRASISRRGWRGLRRGTWRLLTGTYRLLSRAIAFVAAIYLAAYFLTGTSTFKGAVQDAVSASIPGTITAATVRWGPAPWVVRLADARVFDHRGEEIIRVEAIVAQVDLAETLPALARFAADPDAAPLGLYFSRVDLGRPRSQIDVDAAGDVNIERAFVARGPSDPFSLTPDMDLRATVVSVVEASGWVQSPDVRIDVEGLNAVTDYHLTGRGPHMRFDVPRADVQRADVWLSPSLREEGALGRFPITVEDLRVDRFAWDGLAFSWRDAEGVTDDARFRSTGAMDVDATPVAWRGRADIELPSGHRSLHAIFRDLIGPAPQIPRAGPDDAIHASVAGAGTIERAHATVAVEADRLALLGVPLMDVALEAIVAPADEGRGPVAHAITVPRLRGRGFGGVLALSDGRYAPGAAGGARLTGSLSLEGVEAAALLGPALGGAGADARAHIDGRLSGRADVALDLAPFDGGFALSLHVPALDYRWRGSDAVPLGARYTVAGAARYVARPPSTDAEGELAPAHTLDLARIAIDAGPNRVRLEGRIDLGRRSLDLTPYVRFGDARDTARRLGLPPIRGRVVFKAARLTGSFDRPRLDATLSWSDAQVGDRRLGRVVAGLSLVDGVIEVARAHSDTPFGAFEGHGRARLLRRDSFSLAAPAPFIVSNLSARDVDVTAVIGDALGPQARLDVHDVSVAGDLRDIPGSISGAGRATARHVVIEGEPIRRVSARLRASPDLLAIEDAQATLSGGHTVDGSVRITRTRGRLHGNLQVRQLPIASLRAVRGADVAVTGRITADLTLAGTLDRPGLIGRVTLDEIALDDVHLGSADLDLMTQPDGRVDLSSTRFFEGFELLDGSGITLDGFAPAHLRVGVRARDARLGRLFPQIERAGVYVRTSARAELDVWPGRAPDHELRVTAEGGELAVGLREHGVHYVNRTPLHIARRGGELRLAPVTLGPRGIGPRAEDGASGIAVCGAVTRDGALDLQLSGALDLAFLENLGGAFSVLEGDLEIAPDPDLDGRPDGGEGCLSGERDAALRIAGDLDAPSFAGRLSTRGITIVPRGFGRHIRLNDGGVLVLRAGDQEGEQIVRTAEGRELSGELDDGAFAVRGESTWQGLSLRDADLMISATDVTHTSPGTFTVTLNANTRLRARPGPGDAPALSIAGGVVITEGRFMKSFDAFARALGGVVGGTSAGYSKPLALEAPWLAPMTLDLDVVSREFRVESDFPLGEAALDARLDLSIAGTVEHPEIHRRIDLLPGGRLTYNVLQREFEVVSGWLDFEGDPDRPYVDVTARTEVRYIARASTETQDELEKAVAVSLRLSGRIPNIEIEMSSDDPTFDQADIQSLILTGKPRRDLDRSEGVSLVAYDLASVFNDVLKAPFVRTVSVGLGSQGEMRTRIGTCFGPNLCFGGAAVQETTETRLRAGFTLELDDDLTCAGTLRRRDRTTTSASTAESYEARCRYRIPLD